MLRACGVARGSAKRCSYASATWPPRILPGSSPGEVVGTFTSSSRPCTRSRLWKTPSRDSVEIMCEVIARTLARQSQTDDGPAARPALDIDRAAVLQHDVAGAGEPDAGAGAASYPRRDMPVTTQARPRALQYKAAMTRTKPRCSAALLVSARSAAARPSCNE